MKINLILSLVSIGLAFFYGVVQLTTLFKEGRLSNVLYSNSQNKDSVFQNKFLREFADDKRINEGEPFNPELLLENAKLVVVRSLSESKLYVPDSNTDVII